MHTFKRRTNKKSFIHFCTTSLLLLGLHPVISLGDILKLDDTAHYTLENKIDYYIDSTKKLTIDELVKNPAIVKFQTHPQTILQLESFKTPIWIKITLENTLSRDQNLLLLLDYHWISRIDFYDIKANGEIAVITTGVDLPNATKKIESQAYVFPINIPAFSQKTYYLKIINNSLTRIPLSISNEQTFIYSERIINIISGIYYGIMIAMLIYNLFLLITVRDIAYFYYIGILLFSIAYQAGHGAVFSLILPNAIWWNQNSIVLSVPIILVCIVQFGRSFLHTKKRLPKFDYAMRLVLVLAALLLIIPFTGQAILAQKLISITALFVIISQLTAGILVYRQGFKPAIYYIFAYTVFVIFSTIVPAAVLGLIPYGPFVAWTYQIGSATESVLLSLALADRINAMKRETYEFIKAATEANAKTVAKSEFLAKMSHEIRTPMNGVLGMATLLNSTHLDNTQRFYTSVIQNSGKALLNVINDILDLSKIEAKKIELENIDFQLNDIVDECSAIFVNSAYEKKLTFFCNIQPQVPNNLIGDPSRLRQIILNLLSNAFKFTNKGLVRLNVEIEKVEKSLVRLKFTVKDSGIGIDQDTQKNLFQSFTQADASITRKYGGTGLGLTIARQLTELMHGEMGVKSALNQGSTFWFTADFKYNPSEQLSLENIFEGYRVYIITNAPLFRSIFNEHVNYWGMKVIGQRFNELIQELKNKTFIYEKSFIIIDIDSQEFFEEDLLYLTEQPFSISPIFLTEKVNFNEVNHANLLVNQLTKLPITSHQLYELIHSTIIHNSLLKNSKQHTAIQIENDHKDFSELYILVAEDNMVNQLVITEMLRQLGTHFILVNNGRDAVACYKNDKKINLILMDCEMPEMDGYTATREIRNHEKKSACLNVPIIALTAHAILEYREKSLEVGMNDHLTKPIEISKLIAMLEKWQPKQLTD